MGFFPVLYVTNTGWEYTASEDSKSATVEIPATNPQFSVAGGALSKSTTDGRYSLKNSISFTTVYNVNGVEITTDNTMEIVNPSAGDKFVYLNENGKEIDIVLDENKVALGASPNEDIEDAIKTAEAESPTTIIAGLYLKKSNGTYAPITGLAKSGDDYTLGFESKAQTGATAEFNITKAPVTTNGSEEAGEITFTGLAAGAYEFTLSVVQEKAFESYVANQAVNDINKVSVSYKLPSLTVSKK